MLGHVCTAMFLSVINEIFSNKLHCFYKKSIHECVRSLCIISTKITIKVSGIIGATSYLKPGLVGSGCKPISMLPLSRRTVVHLGRNERKPVFGDLRIPEAQTSLHIRAV